jgi:hypothetical protein
MSESADLALAPTLAPIAAISKPSHDDQECQEISHGRGAARLFLKQPRRVPVMENEAGTLILADDGAVLCASPSCLCYSWPGTGDQTSCASSLPGPRIPRGSTGGRCRSPVGSCMSPRAGSARPLLPLGM